MYVAAVIPTIDEAATIGELVRALDKVCDQVIVADASTSMGTEIAALNAGAVFLSVLEPGLEAAYDSGWNVADKDWHVAHIDAGGSHDPADLYPMLDLAEEGFDVVIGSRFCPRGQHLGTWRRKVTSRLASSALNLISLADIADWTGGYRVYSPAARAILAAHEFTTSGHAWQIESLWVLRQAGMRVVEHPITYRPSASHLSAGRVREALSLYGRLVRE